MIYCGSLSLKTDVITVKKYVKAILLLNMFVMSKNFVVNILGLFKYLNNLRMFTTKFLFHLFYKSDSELISVMWLNLI